MTAPHHKEDKDHSGRCVLACRRVLYILGILVLLQCAGSAHADIISAGVDQAQRCMRVFIETNVAPGVAAGLTDFLRRPVNREAIVKDAVANCATDLMALLLHFYPSADKVAIRASMMIESSRTFDLILLNASR
jgi:hypothetical protein